VNHVVLQETFFLLACDPRHFLLLSLFVNFLSAITPCKFIVSHEASQPSTTPVFGKDSSPPGSTLRVMLCN